MLYGDGHPDAMGEFIQQLIHGLLPTHVINDLGGPRSLVNIHALNLCSTLEEEVEETDNRGHLVAPRKPYFQKHGKEVSKAIRLDKFLYPFIFSCGATCLAVEKEVAKEEGWFIFRFGGHTLKVLGTSLLETILSGGSKNIKTNMGRQQCFYCAMIDVKLTFVLISLYFYTTFVLISLYSVLYFVLISLYFIRLSFAVRFERPCHTNKKRDWGDG